jgi:hypothetical protein
LRRTWPEFAAALASLVYEVTIPVKPAYVTWEHMGQERQHG